MVTGRTTPIIPMAVRPLSGHGFSGRRNAQRALDGNSFMCGANPYLSNLDSQVLQNGKSLVDGYTPKNNLITIIKENADENRGFTGKRFDTGAD